MKAVITAKRGFNQILRRGANIAAHAVLFVLFCFLIIFFRRITICMLKTNVFVSYFEPLAKIKEIGCPFNEFTFIFEDTVPVVQNIMECQ